MVGTRQDALKAQVEVSRLLDRLTIFQRDRDTAQARINQKEVERNEYNVALAKKAFYPNFEAEFSWFNRRDLPEMYGLMFRAKILLYFWRKQRPELESAAAGLVQQRRIYDNTLATLYFKLKDPFLKRTADANLLELYGNAIVPQTTLALESSISSYRVGTVDFLSLLSNHQPQSPR